MTSLASAKKQVIEHAREHVWPHQLPWNVQAEQEGLKIFASGKNTTLVDIDGREYLDGISGLWVVNAGHGREEIANAMAEQAKKLAYVSSVNFTNEPAAHLAHKLAEIAPGDLSRSYFVSGGSEAVETAMKIAKQVQAMRGFSRRYKVIARRGSYHGMTHGAMSLTASREEKWFGPFMYGVSSVPAPNRYRNDFGLEGEAGDIMAAKYVEQEIINQGPETVACVIGEPISSAAGIHVPSPIYWKMLREICDRHGVILIADEVINGFGRTGTMFCMEQMGVTPDIMTIAKGLTSGYVPMGAAVVSPKIFAEFENQPEVSMGHLLTFGGHAVAAAAALANLQIFEDENLVARSAEMGVYLREQLEQLRSHPSVGDVRGVGLLQGIEVVKNKETKEALKKTDTFCTLLGKKVLEKGLVTRTWNIVHFAPPLVVTKDEIDRMVAIVDEALTETEAELPHEIEG
ncbi:MAG: aspartate aminotransferase family protein [Thermomicrobiales bacterium]|nr:aspartate aminotransferase family protein [Thermomicrobiales bacterium]MCO5226895.1 aspartate aminotransferase family protein [Thermomicrobiales bacterium]